MEFDFEAEDKDGHRYYRQGGQWFKSPFFFGKDEKFPTDYEKIPDDVKQKLRIEEEKMMSDLGEVAQSNESSAEYDNIDDDYDEIKQQQQKKENTSTSTGNILSRSKRPNKHHHQVKTTPTSERFDLRKTAIIPLSGKKIKELSKLSHLSDNMGKKEKLPYVLITDSQQLIRPIRAELKVKEREMVQQLLTRMKMRKRINTFAFDEEEEVTKLKPFEPKGKKRDLKYVDEYDQNRVKINDEGMKLVVKIESYKHQRKILRNAKISEEELVSAGSVKHMRLKPEVCFKIEDLSQFAADRGLVVLNLDKFILSTDRRIPIYNSNGDCNFCLMHGIRTEGPHPDHQDCPYKFCNCANCYVVGKFGNRLEEFFSLDKDDEVSVGSTSGNKEDDDLLNI